jgi:hypothetical protein
VTTYLVRVETEVRLRDRLDALVDALSMDDRVQLLSAGFEGRDAPLSVRLRCAEGPARARAAVAAALGVDLATTVVAAEAEPARRAGPPWLVLVEVAGAPDAEGKLLSALGAGVTVARSDDETLTAFFAVDGPRATAEETARAVVAEALAAPAAIRVASVSHPDGGPA